MLWFNAFDWSKSFTSHFDLYPSLFQIMPNNTTQRKIKNGFDIRKIQPEKITESQLKSSLNYFNLYLICSRCNIIKNRYQPSLK